MELPIIIAPSAALNAIQKGQLYGTITSHTVNIFYKLTECWSERLQDHGAVVTSLQDKVFRPKEFSRFLDVVVDVTLRLLNFENRLADRFAHLVRNEFRVLFFVLLQDSRQDLKSSVSVRKLVHCEGRIGFKSVFGSLNSVVQIYVFDVVELPEQLVVLWI